MASDLISLSAEAAVDAGQWGSERPWCWQQEVRPDSAGRSLVLDPALVAVHFIPENTTLVLSTVLSASFVSHYKVIEPEDGALEGTPDCAAGQEEVWEAWGHPGRVAGIESQ